MTLQEVARHAREDLERAGIASATAALDTELIARHVLRWSRADWLTRRTQSADDTFRREYAALLTRRIAREPIAYIRGVQEFWGRDFRVTPAVLIPRPETELVVETALAELTHNPQSTVVDIGTGSGCIAITLALETPYAQISATDISASALEVARDNAQRLGARAIDFRHGAYLADVPLPLDLVVSNPPYVATIYASSLEPEVRDHEPATALFAGPDGLTVVREVLQQSRSALRAGGCLILEIGDGQHDEVAAEVAAISEFEIEEVRCDLQGISRAAVIRKR